MKKIVAIGGGENGHENRPYETEKIDKEIVRISNKNNPKLLFIGFAGKEYEKSYYDVIKRNFESIGCTTTLFKYGFPATPFTIKTLSKTTSLDGSTSNFST